ncbi:hypothetical protein PV325_011217 [Microctonus aethiopoides]|nr:hypothetical protein PV325_011217 [Microctonus aethiopoides]
MERNYGLLEENNNNINHWDPFINMLSFEGPESPESDMEEESTGSTNELDDNSLLEIFSYLSMRDIMNAAKVCRKWRRLCEHSWTALENLQCIDYEWLLFGKLRGQKLHLKGTCPTYLEQILMKRGHGIKYFYLSHNHNLRAGCGIFFDSTILESMNCDKSLNSIFLNESKLASSMLLSQTVDLVNLTHLSLRGDKKLKDLNLMNVINNCKRLKYLDLTQCSRITDAGIISLAKLNDLDILEISYYCVINLIKNSLNLKVLDLSYCSIGNATIEAAIEVANKRIDNGLTIKVNNTFTINGATQRKGVAVEQLNEDNWDRMLTGEWMVEFFAPWCPACKDLEPVWSYLGEMKKDLGINVGKVDVTNSPGLSGRFMVTALPTIYHVKDGLFRQYKSPRDRDSLISFVRSKTWIKVDPIPSWKSPTSIQMSIISQFFKMSQILRGVHNKLMEDFGLPTWGSYLIFAIATIIIGAFLGLVIVCVIDFIYPPKPAGRQGHKKQKDSNDNAPEKLSDDEELVENIKDDLVDEDDSDSEKQTESKDKKNFEETAPASSPNARKRKSRKAD